MISLEQHMRPAEIEAVNEVNKTFAFKEVEPGANVSIEGGGYIRFGNLVFVDLMIRPTGTVAMGSAICTGLPEGMTTSSGEEVVSPLFACDDNGTTSNLFYLMTNEVCTDAELSAGPTYYVNGVYFASGTTTE